MKNLIDLKTLNILVGLALLTSLFACNINPSDPASIEQTNQAPSSLPVNLEATLKACSSKRSQEQWLICNSFYQSRKEYRNILSALQNYTFRNPKSRLYKAMTADQLNAAEAQIPVIRENLMILAEAYDQCQEGHLCTLPPTQRTPELSQAARSMSFFLDSSTTQIENIGGYLSPIDTVRSCLSQSVSPDPRVQVRADLLQELCTAEKGDQALYSEVVSSFDEGSPHSILSTEMRAEVLTQQLPLFGNYLASLKKVAQECGSRKGTDEIERDCKIPARPISPLYEIVIDSFHFDSQRGLEP